MVKRYEVTGSHPFQVSVPYGRWVAPGGGFIEEELEPERERFLISAGYLKEVPSPAPASKKKTQQEEA